MDLISWLEAAGHEQIITIDDDSTFEPLLDSYTTTPHRVHRLDENLGLYASLWSQPEFSKLIPERPYVLTDSDMVPDDDCQADLVTVRR